MRPAPTPGAGHADALASFNAAAQTLLWAALGLGLGCALGAGLALALRRRGLAWSWAALTVAVLAPLGALPVVLGLGPLSASALAVGFGLALAALGLGAHLELEDRRAGADRAIAAGRRRRPLDGWRNRRRERRSRARADGVPLGRGPRGELASVARGSAASGRHTLIPGASGAGKTTSLASLLAEHVAAGFGAVVIEAKNDATLLATARAAADARGVTFRMLSPSGPDSYDPLAHGSVDERSERLIAVESWGSADAGFYRQAASPFLRLVIRVLEARAERLTLAAIARGCEPDALDNLALDLDGLRDEVSATLAALRSDQQRAVAGLRARLQNLASSDFAGHWLDPTRAGARPFDLRGVIERREVAYLRLDTDRTGHVGRAIAQIALLDLGAVASALMGAGVGTFVAIDEFGALEAPALDRLYTRGRAAGFSVALGTQTLADLAAAGPAVRERIGATVSSIVCHRIGEQADAEWVAELIGAVPTWQSTIRTDGLGAPSGEGTRTRGYRFEVNPSELQRLGTGEAYVARLDRAGDGRAVRARIAPPWTRLAGLGAPGPRLDQPNGRPRVAARRVR